MNNLNQIKNLNNRYFIIRHGESEANVLGIILSFPEEGVLKFGLSEKGKTQVRDSILLNKVLDSDTIIYSSDFKRAKETAEIAKDVLGAKILILTPKLRERNFGKWEHTDNKNYNEVWKDDKSDFDHNNGNVESANSVLKRTTELILELEKNFKNKKILLSSHGDALQILQTGFMKVSASKHRDLSHLNVAEIRELKLADSF
jgi:probable phosphoglycerate mutase